jgi:hypothetical protein
MAGASAAAALLVSAAPAHAHDGEHAEAHAPTGNLGDLVADLYGGDGITIDAPGHQAHFTADSQEALTNLGNLIASNLGTYSFNSTVSAVSFDLEQGVPVRTQESLGPVLAERATSIGRGRINLAASYSLVDYRQLNGVDLDKLSLDLGHQPIAGSPAYVNDVIRLNLDLRLKQHLLAFFGTYGLTDSVDVSLIVPVIRMEGKVTSVAEILDRGGAGTHVFGTVSPISSNSATATGLGDISLRAKWHMTDGLETPVRAAVVAQFTFATGDENDLLGSGSHAAYVGAVASGDFGRINPHINIGYEHFFDDDSGGGFERSNARAVAGFDIRAGKRVSISTEFLGRWESDGDDFYDFALGAKWEAFKGVPLIANVIFPINRDKGLRPDYVIMVGAETTF